MEKTKTSCSDSNSNDSAKLLKRFFQQSFRFCFSFNFATCFCGVQSGATSFATSWHLDDFCFFHTKNKQSPKGCHFKMLCDVIQDIQPSMYVQQNWGEICLQMDYPSLFCYLFVPIIPPDNMYRYNSEAGNSPFKKYIFEPSVVVKIYSCLQRPQKSKRQ